MLKYHDLSNHQDDLRDDYLLNCLLRARIDTHHETDQDEDVNVYLVDLMSKYMHGEYLTHIQDYLSKFDTEISEKVRLHNDHIYTYYTYKTNADYYLLGLSIFGGLEDKRIPEALRITEKNFSDRARSYYSFAADLNRQIFHKATAVRSILVKLSRSLPDYLEVLHYVREKFFRMEKDPTLSDGEWFHLEREVNQESDKVLFKEKVDVLLDLYSSYRRNPDAHTRERIVNLVNELKSYDPKFEFPLDKLAAEPCG